MAISQTMTTQAKYVALQHIASGTLKMALYTSVATLNANTTAYTSSDEISGTGYVAGGKTLVNVTVQQADGVAYLDFDDVTWDPASFTARGALIYNSSLGNLAIAVLDFGSDKTANNTFTVQTPVNTSSSALVRIA